MEISLCCSSQPKMGTSMYHSSAANCYMNDCMVLRDHTCTSGSRTILYDSLLYMYDGVMDMLEHSYRMQHDTAHMVHLHCSCSFPGNVCGDLEPEYSVVAAEKAYFDCFIKHFNMNFFSTYMYYILVPRIIPVRAFCDLVYHRMWAFRPKVLLLTMLMLTPHS